IHSDRLPGRVPRARRDRARRPRAGDRLRLRPPAAGEGAPGEPDPGGGTVRQRNETKERSLSLLFRYADQKGLPLLDLSDLRALLTFLASEDGKAELTGIGGVANSTLRGPPPR